MRTKRARPMRSRSSQVLVPILVGVLLAAMPAAWAGPTTPATGDDGSDPSVPESTVAPPTTDPGDTETAPPDDAPVDEDDDQSALAVALGIVGIALLIVLAGTWMIRRSDLDALPPVTGPPGWPKGDMP